MTKRDLGFFLAGISLFIWIGARGQVSEKFDRDQLTNIYSFIENPSFKILTTTPTIDSLIEGQALFVCSSGALSIVARAQGNKYFVNLTKM